MTQQNEASVEEILESIKKVIARDSSGGEFLMRTKSEPQEEALVEPAAEDEAEEVLDLSDMEYLGDEGLVEPEDELDAEVFEEALDEEEPALTTEAAAGAMRDNLAALAMLSEPPARPQIVRSGETSLEGLAREMLRPMLAEWLDKNLPGMVEQMVQAEIARIAGKRK
ncbi:DUF2497 domain-containing protein [Erythrobacter sp. HA6-11]